MGQSWFLALGLVLIIEGLLPFLAPSQWRQAMEGLAKLRDGQLRFLGLGAILVGVLLIWL